MAGDYGRWLPDSFNEREIAAFWMGRAGERKRWSELAGAGLKGGAWLSVAFRREFKLGKIDQFLSCSLKRPILSGGQEKGCKG